MVTAIPGRRACALAAAFLIGLPALGLAQGGSYVNFETIPTRALALSPDGTRLFATNTPDGRLEIFDVTPKGLRPAGSVPVGLDPVAVAARSDREVWVVNHLSDSVSVVDVGTSPSRVVRTLLVGDEPRDIVFAGPGGNRAFITAARRGQNHPDNTVEETQRPGLGRADVWVFDANQLGDAAGGVPLEVLTLFADKPGAMATSPDGRTVFVSIFTSGNQTTTIADPAVCAMRGLFSRQGDGPCALPNGGMGPGGVPGPNENAVDGRQSPRVGIIAKFDGRSGAWLDQAGRDWRTAVPFSLPDNDVFTIDAMATPPRESGVFQHAGTLNKSVAVHPTSGKAYLATIDAVNTNRFLSVPRIGAFPNPGGGRGMARTADPLTGKTLNGHLYESRIAILSPGGRVDSRHLNKHIDYEVVPSPRGVKERSVSDPVGLAFSPDGSTLWVAALGSNQIVPFQTAQLDDDSFVPDAKTHIDLSGDGGPTDMVLDASGQRMFVYKRFDNAVATVDLQARKEVGVAKLFSPEPREVREGRKFFYDARLGSSNGEANCNVCHPAADKDDLAWDLGSPFSGMAANPNPFVPAPGIIGLLLSDPEGFNKLAGGFVGEGVAPSVEFNPLKGPMTVLTLRGIKDSGPLFWRGDATNADNPLDERKNFQNFNVVFEGLLGRDGPLPQKDFDKLTDWVLSIVPPPNPHRALDNSLNADQRGGQNVFMGREGSTDVIFSCMNCHTLDPSRGFFGTSGRNVVEGETQFFKVTQLRTVYDKVGMFGQTDGNVGDPDTLGGARAKTGPQIRGTGTLHDGSDAGAEEFLTASVFQLNARQLKQVVDFTYAFPSNLAPIVGQQVTLRADSGPDASARIDLFEQRAAASFVLPGNRQAKECELVARGVVDGRLHGFLFLPEEKAFVSDQGQAIPSGELRALARKPGQELTFTCVYPGGGVRIALDRDGNGTFDDGETAAPARLPMVAPEPPTGAEPPPQAEPGGGLAGFLRGLLGGLIPGAGGMRPASPAPAPAPAAAPGAGDGGLGATLRGILRSVLGGLLGGEGTAPAATPPAAAPGAPAQAAPAQGDGGVIALVNRLIGGLIGGPEATGAQAEAGAGERGGIGELLRGLLNSLLGGAERPGNAKE